MKTYEEICNEIAKEWGCNSWKEMDWYHVNYSGEYPINGQYAQEALTQEAAERYANYKAEIAHDNACKAQLQLISDNFRANAHKGDKQSDIDVFQAIAETIKNHPQPENPYSKK